MRARTLIGLGLLAGCGQLFSLTEVLPDAPRPPDAPPDAPPDYFQGCADGTREGFHEPARYPAIAACEGAWLIAGLRPELPAMCDHMAGNDGLIASGANCSATDLCAPTWHVCRSSTDVYASLPPVPRNCSELGAGANKLFATAQSGPGGGSCNATGTNDFFGCGTYGLAADVSCTPLDKISDNMCFSIAAIGGWVCPSSTSEITTAYKTNPAAGGGVLCCRDPAP